MPIYSVQGPNGKIYDIEGPAGASEQQIIATLQQHLTEAPAPAKQPSILESGARGFESAVSTGRTGLASLMGGNEAAQAGLQRQEEIANKYGPEAGWEEVKKAYSEKGLLPAIGEYARQVPHALAEQAPQIAASMAGARVGAATPVPGGALLGAAVPSYMQQYGGFLESQAEEQKAKGEVKEDIDLGHEDNEPHMIKGELYQIGKYAMKLYATLEELEETGEEIDFPAWWQSKITTAKNMMSGAKHYLDFELKEPYIDAAVDALTGEEPHEGEPEAPMMEAEIGKDEILAGKIMKALKDMANKDASDQHNLKQARIALNKGNMDAAKKIAKPYLSEKIAKQLKSK